MLVSRQETPNTVWQWGVNVPDPSNSSYGTGTNEVGHGRNCSSSTYINLYRGAHKIFMQELPMSIPEEQAHKIVIKGPAAAGAELTRS